MRTINTPGNLGNDYFALDLRYENPDGSVLPSGQDRKGGIEVEVEVEKDGGTLEY